ncbi:tetratricopeptide repeat protein [Thalassoroseus pseudoceratinae]|uniref:tetratricopeptide repeat protein n=1 Tax=Thalassoroseus pseudoceratinae TaxID=2713176 RepID=UPI001421FBF1|nr:tetratricopeptide repeat protein [Thalassoroseus pseudoceratinae]
MSQAADSYNKEASSPPAPNRYRLWIFRLLTVGLALMVFLIAEFACRLFGLGHPSLGPDPFAGFHEVRPLFILDEAKHEYRIPESRYNFFAPESFAQSKPSRAKRIFCLGGSTVQGRPYSTPTSFPTFLEMALDEVDQSNDWTVVNCGGISYASYRLVPILEEVLNYDPDFIILCTGHNEFLEDRSYQHLRDASPVLKRALRVSSKSRLFNVINRWVHTDASGLVMSAETDPMLDYKNGLAAYYRDDQWRTNVVAHFEFNVRRLIGTAEVAGVPIILVIPPSNLYDCPPFKSEVASGLDPEAHAAWRELLRQAQETMRADPQGAIAIFKDAIAIDGRHAATWYELAKCYQTLGLQAQAEEAFVTARDEDTCPLRMLSVMEDALRRVADECDVPVVDLSVQMRDGHSLVDHVHPDFDAHQKIAKQLAEVLAEHDWCQLDSGWNERVDQCFRSHMDSLEDFYFLKGQRTLDALQGWTQGRSDGLPAEQRFPNRIP